MYESDSKKATEEWVSVRSEVWRMEARMKSERGRCGLAGMEIYGFC